MATAKITQQATLTSDIESSMYGRATFSFDLNRFKDATVTAALLTMKATNNSRDTFKVTDKNGAAIGLTWKTGSSAGVTQQVASALQQKQWQVKVTYYPYQSDRRDTVVTLTLDITTEGGGGGSEDEPAVETRSTGSLSAETAEFGDAIQFTITPVSKTCTHKVTYEIGNYEYTETLAADTQPSEFTIPTEWMAAFPTQTSGTMKVYLKTLSGGESAGDPAEYQMTVTVPDSVVPSIGSMTAVAVNSGALEGDARFFLNASTIHFTLTNVAAGTGSTIASITYGGWGNSETVTNPTSYEHFTSTPVSRRGAQGIYVTALATDGRGRTAEIKIVIQTYSYTRPAFGSIQMFRCDSSGVPADQGTSVTVSAVYSYDTENIDGNTASATLRYRGTGDTAWSQPVTLSNGASLLIDTPAFSITRSYEFEFTVQDIVMASTTVMILPSSKFVLHFANNGNAIGIGQASEALAEGEIGRINLNREWAVYMGTDIHIGSQTLAEYIQSIIAGTEGGEITDA